MRINYPKAIGESEEDLMSLEQRLRGQKRATGCACCDCSKAQRRRVCAYCAPLVGYSAIQLTRWWERYRQAGLAELLKQHKPVGLASRMTGEAWASCMVAMRKGEIATMQDARDYLEREWGIGYKNGKSPWWLFKKHRVNWRTGRRRQKKACAEQQAAFKKTSAP